MSLFKYRRANIALFCTTNIQNYFHVSKCTYIYFRIKEVFFSGKLGAIWVGVCFQKSFIPFILLFLLLCNIVFYGNIFNTRNKGEIETWEGTTVGPSESGW